MREAWAPVGIDITMAKTVDEALDIAGLDWEVHKRPIFNEYGEVINGYYSNVRTDCSEVLGIVTDRYKIVQNKSAFNFVDNLIDEDVSFERAGSWKHGKAIWLETRLPEKNKVLGDDFEYFLVFTNAHDGTGAVRTHIIPQRIVCANQLNWALSNAARSWSVRHTGDIQGKLAEAKETLGLARKYMNEFNIKAMELAEQIVTDAELEAILDKIYPIDAEKDSQRKKDNAIKAKNDFFTAYNASDISQFKGTAYGAMNAIADMVDHYAPSRMTTDYQANNWGKIMSGHPVVDTMFAELVA